MQTTLLAKLLSEAISLSDHSDPSHRSNNTSSLSPAASEALLTCAITHQVHPVLWPVLETADWLDAKWKDVWSKLTMDAAAKNMRDAVVVQQIYQQFALAHIPLIPLKGISLQERYPFPELRTMGDADILVHPEDIQRATDELKRIGFSYKSASQKHLTFVHREGLCLDLHELLVDERVQNPESLTQDAWDNAVPYTKRGATVFALTKPYQLLHQTLHIACHLYSGGFGLRQLADFSLILHQSAEQEDWLLVRSSYIALAAKYDVLVFSCHLAKVAIELFDMNTDNCTIDASVKTDESALSALKTFILERGFHGTLEGADKTVGIVSFYSDSFSKEDDVPQKGTKLLKFLFPSAKRMPLHYRYARTHKVLLPIGWMHRIARGLLRNDFGLFDKLSVFTNKKYRERDKLTLQMMQALQLEPTTETSDTRRAR